MADHFIGVNVGSGIEPGGAGGGAAVLTGTSTTSALVELRIHDGDAGLSKDKASLLRCIDRLRAYVVESFVPT